MAEFLLKEGMRKQVKLILGTHSVIGSRPQIRNFKLVEEALFDFSCSGIYELRKKGKAEG